VFPVFGAASGSGKRCFSKQTGVVRSEAQFPCVYESGLKTSIQGRKKNEFSFIKGEWKCLTFQSSAQGCH
jgi:hypothetical protein